MSADDRVEVRERGAHIDSPVYICGPDNLTSRLARKTLPYRLPIHCLPLEVTFHCIEYAEHAETLAELERLRKLDEI